MPKKEFLGVFSVVLSVRYSLFRAIYGSGIGCLCTSWTRFCRFCASSVSALGAVKVREIEKGADCMAGRPSRLDAIVG